MTLLNIDRSELYDIFNDVAFSLFVERHLKSMFGEEEVLPPQPPVTLTWSPDRRDETPTPKSFEHGIATFNKQECIIPSRKVSDSDKPNNKKTRRTPTNKMLELPKQARLTVLRRTKRNKLIWTTTLQQRFLHALSILGTFEATPSDVLHIMNVEGLTRGNISSHLQKYRGRLLQKATQTDEESRWSVSDRNTTNDSDNVSMRS